MRPINAIDDTTTVLLQLKRSLPATCTQSSLVKLEIALMQLKDLPKGIHMETSFLLESKIAAIRQPANSWKESKCYFKEALGLFHQQIDGMIASALDQ